MSITSEVTAELEGKSGPLVAMALGLARRLDDPDEKSAAAVNQELRRTLDVIADQAPAEVNPLDEIERKRAARRANRGAAATGS